MENLLLIISAAAAVFFAVRLYQLLGRRTGHTPEPRSAATPAPGALKDEPVAAGFAAGRSGEGLNAIMRADPDFDPDSFLAGARKAYEMVVAAFAKGDKAGLAALLSSKVHARYAAAIDERIARGETATTEVERIAKITIEDARVDAGLAKVRVRFKADIATETRDRDGKRIAGDLTRIVDVEEIWTFERPIDSRDPNWVLSGVASV